MVEEPNGSCISAVPPNSARRASRVVRAGLAAPLLGGLRNVLADGDWVAPEWGPLAPAVNGAVAYEQSYCSVMRLFDGKIVETTSYLDPEIAPAVLR
jgi:ketosteroid isomerase-like protein